MRYEVDQSNKLSKAVQHVIDKHHDLLNSAELKFIYVWRLEPKMEDGKLIIASVNKLSNRDRDVFGVDVRLEVDKAAWKLLSKEDKIKVLDHELMHIYMERDGELEEGVEENSPEDTRDFKYDKDGRVCFYMVPHDLDIRRFKEEMMRYGLSSEENDIRVFLNKVYKQVGLTNDPNTDLMAESEDSEE